MDAGGAVAVARGLGEIPTLIVVLVLVLSFLTWAIRQMSAISKELKRQKDCQEERAREQDAKIQHLDLACIKRDEFYRELGGWRSELQNLEARLVQTIKLLMEGRDK